MQKSQRPSADTTRNKIIASAKELFLEKGFDGVSINSIAKLAQVNKTLIFHHYQDKINLWQAVKAHIMSVEHHVPQYDTSSAKEYFESVLNYRFKLYATNPDLARLVIWQQVSDEHEALIGNHYCSPNNWLADIKLLQECGEIVQSIDPELIMLFLIYSSHAPFLQSIVLLTKKQIAQYKQIILQSCMTQFSASGENSESA